MGCCGSKGSSYEVSVISDFSNVFIRMYLQSTVSPRHSFQSGWVVVDQKAAVAVEGAGETAEVKKWQRRWELEVAEEVG